MLNNFLSSINLSLVKCFASSPKATIWQSLHKPSITNILTTSSPHLCAHGLESELNFNLFLVNSSLFQNQVHLKWTWAISKDFFFWTEFYCAGNSNFSKTKLLDYLEHLCNFWIILLLLNRDKQKILTSLFLWIEVIKNLFFT